VGALVGIYRAMNSQRLIEAGFPCSSPEDLKAIQAVSEQVKGPVIAGLARAVQQDIDIPINEQLVVEFYSR